MNKARKLSVPVLLSLILIFLLLAVGLSPEFYLAATVGIFLWWAMLGASVLHLRVRPYLSDLLLILVSTTVMSMIVFGTWGFESKFRMVCSFLGLSSVGVLGARACWAEGEERTKMLWAFLPALLFVGVGWLSGTLLYYSNQAHATTLDMYLLSFDCSLGVQPSFWMGNWYWTWPWVRHFGLIFYDGLPILIAASYAEHLVCKREKALPVFLALFYLAPVGVLFYNFFPSAGPIGIFQGDFPFHPLTLMEGKHVFLERVAAPGPRNAMPSLHMSWVLLCWWYARGLSWKIKTMTLTFVIFTVITTLGTGEHWLIDLIVAFPFTLMFFAVFCFSLSWNDRERVRSILIGLGLTFAWFALLRFGTHLFWPSPVIPWTLMAATVAVVYLQRHRLLRTLDAKEIEEHSAAGSAATTAGVVPSLAME